MRAKSRWKMIGGKLKAHIVEEDVVEEIETRLWLQYRIRVWRIRERLPGMGKMSAPGIPDLCGWIPQRKEWHGFDLGCKAVPLFIECKRPGGARRLAQTQFIEDARADGCIAFFAESWDDVVREMDLQGGIKLKEVA